MNAPARGQDARSPGLVERTDVQGIRQLALALAQEARYSLRIFSQDLEAEWYDRGDFLDALRQVAIQGPAVPVRILLLDAEPAVREGHRLVEFARFLTSKVQIRRIPEEYQQSLSYLLSDDRGYLVRLHPEETRVTADFQDPKRVRLLARSFEEIWALGVVHPELRRLYL